MRHSTDLKSSLLTMQIHNAMIGATPVRFTTAQTPNQIYSNTRKPSKLLKSSSSLFQKAGGMMKRSMEFLCRLILFTPNQHKHSIYTVVLPFERQNITIENKTNIIHISRLI